MTRWNELDEEKKSTNYKIYQIIISNDLNIYTSVSRKYWHLRKAFSHP